MPSSACVALFSFARLGAERPHVGRAAADYFEVFTLFLLCCSAQFAMARPMASGVAASSTTRSASVSKLLLISTPLGASVLVASAAVCRLSRF